jgi:3-hydroxybutyryl-CoA dehydrogenase
VRADAILTSTTSSILVTQLAALVERPERFLNIHWLNPAYVIPVVELSTHAGTAPTCWRARRR